MKRFITIVFASVVAMVSSINANAQWKVTLNKGDELRGTEDAYLNYYVSEDGFAGFSSNNDMFMIKTKSSIFDYENELVPAIVGFYQDDKLIEKQEAKFFCSKKQPSTATPFPPLAFKIIKHLKNVGSVRIIVSRYSGSDFDLRIPMNEELKHYTLDKKEN